MKVLKAVRNAIAAKLVRNDVRSVQRRLDEEQQREVFRKKRKRLINLNHPLPWILYGCFLTLCLFWEPLKHIYKVDKYARKLDKERKKYIAELDKIYGPE